MNKLIAVAFVSVASLLISQAHAIESFVSDLSHLSDGPEIGADGTRVIQVMGQGHALMSCDTISFTSCSMLLEDQAKRDGLRQAEFSCQINHGQVEGAGFCSAFCNPFSPPPYPSGPVLTNCDATCYQSCRVPQ